jgi:hypothetical protein
MATCRERYRTHVLSHFPNYDFVIVVDTDLRGGWSYDGVANTFGHDDWDFVGSNGILRRLTPTFPVTYDVRQYDTWALRYAGRDKAYQPWQMDGAVHNPGEPLVPVWSCFGGLGVYSMAAFRAANYGGNDCEHVELYRQMRAAGHSRLFLNPSQIVLY